MREHSHSIQCLLCLATERMKRISFFFASLSSLVFLLALVGCGKITLIDEEKSGQTTPSADGALHGDTLVATNDTARFYLSGVEIHNVMLSYYPSPSTLIKDSRYRLPTKLEVHKVLKNVDIPQGYWKSKQRILCYDHPRDTGVKIGSTLFGSGEYYTFTPHGSVTQAGFQTLYCILPIRTERIEKTTDHTIIEVNDKWDD